MPHTGPHSVTGTRDAPRYNSVVGWQPVCVLPPRPVCRCTAHPGPLVCGPPGPSQHLQQSGWSLCLAAAPWEPPGPLAAATALNSQVGGPPAHQCHAPATSNSSGRWNLALGPPLARSLPLASISLAPAVPCISWYTSTASHVYGIALSSTCQMSSTP
ncbi:hypothetical protein E2C01_016286 [Portunus trituberculatus]|uniref:Uncharacterized protein n=1 Tax=Portunus trituberculatus TaxID=210409 RepID=A0A5B7DQ65_PORTR|nr:hypothetical protein [Portunus trituberculatus]